MEFWTSGEVDLAVRMRDSRILNAMERRLNSKLAEESYGEVAKYAFMAIIMELEIDESGTEWFPEVRQYHKRRKCIEVRARIDHSRFVEAELAHQAQMVCDVFLAEIERVPDWCSAEFDAKRCHTDVKEVLAGLIWKDRVRKNKKSS